MLCYISKENIKFVSIDEKPKKRQSRRASDFQSNHINNTVIDGSSIAKGSSVPKRAIKVNQHKYILVAGCCFTVVSNLGAEIII